MLRQIDIAMKIEDISNVNSELAVKIHGAVMHSIPQETAEKMHIRKYHPFSIFTVPYERDNIFVTRFSSLSEEADCILDTVLEMDSICIKGIRAPVPIFKKSSITQADIENITEGYEGRRYRLSFLTPSCFKVSGIENSLPDIPMHFVSVLNKLREFENINIDPGDFRKLFYEMTVDDWQLRNVRYNISGRYLPGLLGYIDVFLPSDKEKSELLKKVFLYAGFCGTGGRTGMGMGGFILERIPKRS